MLEGASSFAVSDHGTAGLLVACGTVRVGGSASHSLADRGFSEGVK